MPNFQNQVIVAQLLHLLLFFDFGASGDLNASGIFAGTVCSWSPTSIVDDAEDDAFAKRL